ncbi:undecaprenyldiphospho-muramoylpentapeptide beta-N-acetylglucosaminyltransferase [Chryseobacterium lacus]|uniref:undecaprenyldiphospho-muramoylpentapeptide beta-N-acetylglucosaminyltransferase n=1 Tax=Chryseobacterium lacus TaxID=2058346 RepID=UPI000F8884B2|nr:undecaprenyldiphospho-muramoylpentapeptide beta-N-acetylglucosaminyltransferase [Chryseobacterium lacus]RST25641.1 undecaprenyldiphospho-muramoylpentapeptide beta-N-acetylglucosaminyltransferase [Chryseobacterium lacus]
MKNNATENTRNTRPLHILMSGGGTGGHIFPAVAIADEIKKRFPDAEFLFIGANNKMEMEKVPEAGYKIQGLNITGIDRGNKLANIKLPFRLISSIYKAKDIVKNFKPDLAIGTGGFASGPALYAAASFGIPVFIQEQNAHAGITNKILSKSAQLIFTAYPEVKGFPATKTRFLGNPIRESIISGRVDTKEAKIKLGLDPEKLVILSVGGSLGSKTLNNSWLEHLDLLKESNCQLIWQTGKLEYQKLESDSKINRLGSQILLREFITDMPMAYSAADIIVSRAGAIAISELSVAGKPVILVPFPFAAEDHQTMNAMKLVEKNAARMVKDSEMKDKFWATLTELCNDQNLRATLSQNLIYFAKPNATQEIVDEILKKLKTE